MDSVGSAFHVALPKVTKMVGGKLFSEEMGCEE